ncbi:DUF4867 family protein [Halalkalibacter kiskunsagensis]|uniref:DUF4867 family protein n=1 Tax=Halalkalibacter kiskunsagensis TaxID=1548599 RepID=A0ABV6KDU1_9BACI
MLEELKALNTSLNLTDIFDTSFLKYGKVLKGFPVNELEKFMDETDIPQEGNIYVSSIESWEQGEVKSLIEKTYFGCMDIQLGYCNGKNSNLNGLEFHKGSEINVAYTDLVLLLGHVNDIKEGTYSVDSLEVFFVPKGTAIEIYQTTLHLAPCKVSDNGFKCAVILPSGTNTPLMKEEKGHDQLLFMKNKWLLSHPENERFMSQGAHAGIIGENIAVKYHT